MRRHWREGITQLILALLGLMILGAPFDASLTMLFLGLAGYIGWSTWQLVRLHRWLDGRGGSDPPESFGLWGDIFDGIYALQKKQKKSRKRLRKIVHRVRESLSALRDGVIMLDSERSLEWWNHWPAPRQFWGARQERGWWGTSSLRAGAYGGAARSRLRREGARGGKRCRKRSGAVVVVGSATG